MNDTVAEQFRKSGMKLLTELFEDNMETAASGTKAKRAKGSTFQTVSALYRVIFFLFSSISFINSTFDLFPKEQVENLMSTLRKTSPHFVRCIVPNENKEAGKYY